MPSQQAQGWLQVGWQALSRAVWLWPAWRIKQAGTWVKLEAGWCCSRRAALAEPGVLLAGLVFFGLLRAVKGLGKLIQ